MQIYADFSGYTDIAIGIALLLGFTFPQNFDSPYAAVSIQDFWRRWHMTLSRWLRDYLYIPLGGSRRGVAITYRNLLLTMLLGGLWHGAGWTFVAWGLIHGVAPCAERFWRERHGTKPEESFTWVDYFWRRLVTFHVVCFAWIFFRSETFGVAWDMITGLFTRWGQPSPLVTGPVLLAIAVGIGSQYLPPRVPRDPRRLLTPQRRRPGRRARGRADGHPGSRAPGRGTLHLLPVLMAVESDRAREVGPRGPLGSPTEEGRRFSTAARALAVTALALFLAALLNAQNIYKSCLQPA